MAQTWEERKEYLRKWREKNRERIRAQRNAKWRNNPEYREKSLARGRALPPEVRAAHHKVRMALKRGELVRPTVCPSCEREAFCEAAHEDYSRPLDIHWLCRSCHRSWDQIGNGKIKVAA